MAFKKGLGRFCARLFLAISIFSPVIFLSPFSFAEESTAPLLVTDKDDYLPGETVFITGDFFEPFQKIKLLVFGGERGNDYTEEEAVIEASDSGNFIFQYLIDDVFRPLYDVFAFDFESGDELAHITFKDNVGYDKGVYRTDSGVWTTGSAGSGYEEGDWVYYTYAVKDVNASNFPAFNVTFNFYQSSSDAVFVDGFSNFRYCWDCDALPDGTSNPPSDTTVWKTWTPDNINYEYSGGTCSNVDSESNGPAGEHCFYVPGVSKFPGAPASGDHTLRIFFEAHLARTFDWSSGLESELGPGGDREIFAQAHATPSTVYGSNVYSSWSDSYGGVGLATGASRHFNLKDQTLGPKGAITLPIPTVEAPNSTLTIIKDAEPNSDQDFSFNAGALGTFSLDDDNDSTLSNTKVFNLLAAGTYSVSEDPVSGWDVEASCSDGSPVNQINLSSGENVTCTFVNTLAEGTLIVKKHVENPNGGTKTASDFNLYVKKDSVNVSGSPAAGSEVGTTYTLIPGNYVVGEEFPLPTGYNNVQIEGDCDADGNVTVVAGQTKTCTIINHNTPPSLTLVKEVNNDNGGDASPSDWTLLADGPTPISGAGGVTSGETFSAGTYTLSESSGPDGYAPSSWVCEGGLQSGNQITLDVGQSATCTITNDDVAPSLTLNKITNYSYGGVTPESFWTLTADGGVAGVLSGLGAAGSSDVVSGPNFKVGTYSLSESQAPSGYTNGESYSCVKNGGDPVAQNSIYLNIGDVAVCSIVNTDNPGEIHGMKFEDKNGNGAKDVGENGLSDWTIYLDLNNNNVLDQGEPSTVTDSEGNYDFTELPAGTYKVREVTKLGWVQTSSNPSDVNLLNGGNEENINFGNFKYGKISGYKFDDLNGNGVWDNEEPTLEGWTINLGGDGSSSDVTDENGYYEFSDLESGVYSLLETNKDGWIQTTQNPENISIVSGTNSENNNFGNFKKFSISGQKFNDLNADGIKDVGENGLADWTIELDIDADGDVDITTTTDSTGNYNFSDLGPGLYRVREVNQNGWIQTTSNPSDINGASGTDVSGVDFGNYQIQSLLVSKTVETSYKRVYDWTIEKSVNDDNLDLFIGDSQTVNYDVSVTKDSGTDSDWHVSGVITITNPNLHPSLVANISSVTDDVEGVNALVSCPDTSVAGGESIECTYEADLPDALTRTNTATVETNGSVQGGFGNAQVVFGEPTNIVNDFINVSDSLFGPLGETSSTKTFEYSKEFSCGIEEGQYEGLNNLVENVAKIDETGSSDNANITINCYELKVSKTAETSLTRTWIWDINKTGDQTNLNLSPGQIYGVNYDVTLNAYSNDSDWGVSGEIVVENPSPMEATLSSVTDSISGVGDISVNCPTLVVLANDSIVCTYSSALPNADSRVNTALATLSNGEDFSGQTAIDFANADISVIDESITVNDDKYGNLGVVSSSDQLPKVFEYTLNVGPYAENTCGTSQIFANQATFSTNDSGSTGSDNYEVSSSVLCVCSLTQGYWKTHSDQGPAPFDSNWNNLGDVDGDFVNEQEAENFFGSGKTWLGLFRTPPAGNPYYQLAHQYMAAKLNILNGAPQVPSVMTALGSAESLFTNTLYDTPTEVTNLKGKNANSVRQQFTTLAGTLGAFNEGLTNPAGHCSETLVQ